MANIQLRRLQPNDRDQLTLLANNKKVWDNLRDLLPHPYAVTDADFFINLTLEEDPYQNFGIEYNGELVGVIGVILQKDVYRLSGEMGYWIGEPYWGKGIATEAVRLITEYAFNELNLNRVFAGVFEFNQGSIKVLQKNGFQREGIFKKAVIKNDKVWDEHHYYKLKNNQ